MLAGLFVAYGAVCGHIEYRLERVVADKLDAELRLGRLLYVPPLGVYVGSANLVRRQNVIADFGRVDLTLAALPRKGRPLQIDELTIRHPVVRLFKTDEGLVGGPGFVKEPAQPPPPDRKFSDTVRVNRFRVEDGTLRYDRTIAGQSTSMAWHDVTATLVADAGAGSRGAYRYALSVDDDPAVRLRTTGSVDADALTLGIERFALTVAIANGAAVNGDSHRQVLPGELQQILADYRVGGRLVVNGHGTFPFRDLPGSAYEATIQLVSGSGFVPQWDLALDSASAALTVNTERSVISGTRPSDAGAAPGADAPAVRVTIDHVDVGSGGRALSISGGRLDVDPAAGGWKLASLAGRADLDVKPVDDPVAASRPGSVAAKVESVLDRLRLGGQVEFTAAADGPLRPGSARRLDEAVRREVLLYPRSVTIHPPKFPCPLVGIGGGSVRVAGNELIAENLTAFYGLDRWHVATARLALDNLPEQITITEGHGSIEFHAPSPAYPKPLVKVVPSLRPSGTFHVGGRFNADRRPVLSGATTKPVLDYDLLVNSDDGTFELGKTDAARRIPLTSIRGDAVLTRGRVEIRRFAAESFGGRVLAEGTFTHKPLAHPATFAGLVSVRDVDLRALGEHYDLPDRDNRPLRGRGFANVWLEGTLGPTFKRTLDGRGEVEVIDGDFFDIPVLVDILRGVKGADAARAGEAAAVFRIDDGIVHIPNAAVSAPVFGIQGGGRITLDGDVDLNVVAAPLADWEDGVSRTNIPVVSDVAGAIAGATQDVLNTATRQLLYEFRVRGEAKHPEIIAVPAPALSDAGAALFGEMLGGHEKERRRLLESVRGDEPPTSQPRQR